LLFVDFLKLNKDKNKLTKWSQNYYFYKTKKCLLWAKYCHTKVFEFWKTYKSKNGKCESCQAEKKLKKHYLSLTSYILWKK